MLLMIGVVSARRAATAGTAVVLSVSDVVVTHTKAIFKAASVTSTATVSAVYEAAFRRADIVMTVVSSINVTYTADTGGALLLETGDFFLLETGDKLLIG